MKQDSEIKDFLNQLFTFHLNRGTNLSHHPELNGHPIDLYRIFQRVRSFGGVEKVNEKGLWVDIAEEFGIGHDCLNGSEAVKYIYLRYLYLYEKSLSMAVVGDALLLNEDDEEGRKKGLSTLQRFSQVSNQSILSDTTRSTLGLKRHAAHDFRYEKIKLALISGFPNELIFVLNTLLLVSCDVNKFCFKLSSYPTLLDILLARVGCFKNASSGLLILYRDWWQPVTGFSFLTYWNEVVMDDELKNLFLAPISHFCHGLLKYQSMFNVCEPKHRRAEDIIVEKIVTILNNLVYEENTAEFLAQQEHCWRFLILCINSNRPRVRHTALDCCVNLTRLTQNRFFVGASLTREHFLRTLNNLLYSDDICNVKSGLLLITELCRGGQESRAWIVNEIRKNKSMLSQLGNLLTTHDVLIVLTALELFYQLTSCLNDSRQTLSDLEEIVNFLIDSFRFVKLMCCFISSGAKCLPNGSYDLVKLVEECSVSQSDIGERQQVASMHNVVYRADPNNRIVHWLQSTLEANPLLCIYRDELQAAFRQFASVIEPKLLSLAHLLPILVLQVFPSARIDENNGLIIGVGYQTYRQNVHGERGNLAATPAGSTNAHKRPYSPKGENAQSFCPKRACYPFLERTSEAESGSAVLVGNLRGADLLKAPVVSEVPIERMVNLAGSSKKLSELDVIHNLLRKMVFEVSCRIVAQQRRTASDEMRVFLRQHFNSFAINPRAPVAIDMTTEIEIIQRARTFIDEWQYLQHRYRQRMVTSLGSDVGLHVRHVLQIIINTLEVQIADNPTVAGDQSCRDALNRLEALISTMPRTLAGRPENIVSGMTPPAVKCPDASEVIECSVQKIFNRSAVSGDGNEENGKCICEWQSCCRLFPSMHSVLHHVCSEHMKTDEKEFSCLWSRCNPTIRRKRWAFVTHLQECHCVADSTKSVQRRPIQSHSLTRRMVPPAEWGNRSQGEGPVSRSMRLLGALICRNISRCNNRARRLICASQDTILTYAVEDNEASKTLSVILSEMNNLLTTG